MKRAIRRHHVERLKNKRKHYYGYDSHNPMASCRLGKVVQYPKDCSCTSCGNPRKWFKSKTTKERLNILNHLEQCEEAGLHISESYPRNYFYW